MGCLRKLEQKDADLMLEWMKDKTVNCYFSNDFASYNLDKVRKFINESFNDKNQHFAVVNTADEYQGTISLKNISFEDFNAEYAVVFRKTAQGTGLAKKASIELLNYAFDILKLKKVYLNVLEDNIRARKLYEKIGFKQEGTFYQHKFINNKFKNLCWYGIFNENI